MSRGEQSIFPEAASASRRNGARSKGPRSASGKARSARNSLKHGLFGPLSLALDDVSPAITDFIAVLDGLGAGGDGDYNRAAAIEAALRLERATRLVGQISGDVAALIAGETFAAEQLDETLRKLLRFRRYQRRFRGQRDRNMRAFLGRSPRNEGKAD